MSQSKLPAILGGPKAVTLDQSEANRWPIITAEDEAAVLDVMRSGDLSTHAVANRLEKDFRERLGVKHALAHCNGTAALHAAFFAIGLKPGDEVIVPSATFWASVVPVLWMGAVPIFAESETDRLGLDPADVGRKITPRTRAIVVVHLFGMPSRMTELLEIARKYDLKIIEDASHAAGASWRSRPCGTLGDAAVFSLQTNKLLPAGEGGMLLTDSREIIERAILFGDMVRILELESPSRRFAGTTFGVKTRIASMSAAVARSQLKRLDERNERRNENLIYLSKQLEQLGIDTFRGPSHVKRVYFEFVVRCDFGKIGLPAEVLVEALQAEDCSVSLPRYPLLHQQPFFTEGRWKEIARIGQTSSSLPVYCADALPQTEAANAELLKLPSFPSASPDLLDQYAAAFEKVFANRKKVLERRERAARSAG